MLPPKRRIRSRSASIARRPGLESLERREMLAGVPTADSAGIHQVGLGTYTENFPDNANYPEYLSPSQMDYHAPTTIYLSGAGSSPSLVFPSITPGSPFLDNPDPSQNKPVVTSDWWSSLLFRRQIEQSDPFTAMQPHPLSLLAHADGLGMAYVDTPTVVNVGPGDPRGPGAQFVQYQYPETAPNSGVKRDDLVVGLKELTNLDPGKVTVYDYSDWTVTADWDGKMRATAGHGLPSVDYEFPAGGTAQIGFGAGLPATLVQNFGNGSLLVKVGTRYYGLFGPTSAAGDWDTSNPQQYALKGLTAQTGYLSVALMPDGFNPATDTATTFALYRQHAYNFVTGSLATYAFEESTGRLVTTYALTTVFKDNPADASLDKTSAIQALYPTQWLALTGGTVSTLSYTSARGEMKVLASGSAPDQFRTTLQYQGTLPFLPDINSGEAAHLALWTEQLLPYLEVRSSPMLKPDRLDLANLIRGGDVYSLGQSMLGAAQLVPILDQVAQSLQASTNATTKAAGALAAKYASDVLDHVKDEMGAWLSATDDDRVKFLYYDRNFDALLATPGAYESSDGVNDQHLGFGYFLKSAALIAQYDPSWAAPSAMGGMIRLIIDEVANPAIDTRGAPLPRLRNFDPYAGHSWADGSANSDNGNNQESSSEGLNFASGLIQWGEVTGDDALRDLGVYLFTTESNSVKYVYFNQQNPANPASHVAQGYNRPQIAILESVGGEYQTFFDVTPAVVETIQFLPFTGSSYYLADLGTFLDASGKPVVDATYNETNFQAGKGGPNSNPLNVYQNPLYMYRALQGQAQAKASLAYLFNPTTGVPNYLPFDGAPGTSYGANNGVDNPAFNVQWLNVLAAYGRPDRTVTANTTLYGVFVADDGTTKTYAAFNPTASPLAVTFSDGFVLNVPARSLKTSAGLASGAPADSGLSTGSPDRGLVASPNRLYLAGGGQADPSEGSFTIGQTGAFESRVAIPGANNGAVKAGIQARTPPDAPSISFTTTGVNATYDKSVDPTRPLQFRIWLDGGVIPEGLLTSQVGLLFEVFNNGGAGASADYFVRYSEYALPSSSPTGIITGYRNAYDQDYGPGVVDFTGKSAGQSIPNPPDLINATIRVTLYTSLGLTPVTVRVDAAEAQGRLSYVDIPYIVATSAPTVAVTSPSDTSNAGAPATFTATVTQAGTTPFTGMVQFLDNGAPIGGPMSLGTPTTSGGITAATATLSGFTGLAAGSHAITAQYFTPSGITLVSQLSGGVGQIVKILGTNLGGASRVTFGGVPAARFSVDSPTQITAVVGGGGTGPIAVTTPGGVVTSASPFTFRPASPAPVLSDYNPPAAGPGAQITLTGTGFTGATRVTVGGVAVQSFTVVSAAEITMILSNTSASGPIEVTTPTGVASSADLADATKRRFLIGGSGPTINTISALSGASGQVIVISGQLFDGVTQVTIGGVPAKSFHLDIPTQITAVVGSGASGPVVVTTPNGTSTSYQLFAFGSANSFLIPSPPIDHTVVAATRTAPTIAVTTSYPRLPYAITTSSLTFTATLSGRSGTPTGSVVFRVDGDVLATVPVAADGTATFTPDKPLLPGTYALTADYLGDSIFLPATSAPISQVVTRINPLIEFVDAVANPAIGGQVILRAKLISQYPSNGYAPSGSLDFYEGQTFLGHGDATFAPGIFTFTMDFSPDPAVAVIHNIRVEYRGDTYYYPDTFPACGYPLTILPATQTQPIATTTTVTAMMRDSSGAPKAVIGQSIFFNATVSPTNPPAGYVGYISGKVIFEYQAPTAPNVWVPMDANPTFLLLYYTGLPNTDQTDLGQLPSFRPQAAGTYLVRARFLSQIDFAGDPNPQYADSVGTFTVDVEPPGSGFYPTATALVAAQAPGLPPGTTVLDQAIVFTATVTSPNAWASGPFAGLVTADGAQAGSVQFYRNGSPFALLPMTPTGQAVLTLPSEPAGDTSWSAQYVPNPAFPQFTTGSRSAVIHHTVQLSDPARLSIALSPPASPLITGQAATLTVRVSGQSALGLGTPSGTVQLVVMNGKTDYGGTIKLDPSGAATFTTAALPAGTYSLSAIYNADGSDKYFPSKTPRNTAAVQTFTVSAPNMAPVNTVPAATATGVNRPIVFASALGNAVRVGDPDAGHSHLGVTLSAEHGTITLASSRGLDFLVGDGQRDARVSFTGAIEDLNAALDGLMFTPDAGYRGPALLTISTDDWGNGGSGGALSDLDTIPISVRGPAFAPIADVTVDEGQTAIVPVAASDPERPGAAIRYSLGPDSPAGARIDAATGVLSWTVPSGALSRLITVRASEDGLADSATMQTFQISARNVAPIVQAGPDTSIPSALPFSRAGSFADPGADTWVGTVDYGDGTGPRPLAIASDKTFQLAHAYDRAGLYTVTVTIADEASASRQSFVVNVRDVPPVVVRGVSVVTTRNVASGIALTFSDDVDAASATTVANYRIRLEGRDHRFGTRDDLFVPVVGAQYMADSRTVLLRTARPLKRSVAYQLTVNGGSPGGLVGDIYGRLLDGDRDGQAGGAYVVPIDRSTPRGAAPADVGSRAAAPVDLHARHPRGALRLRSRAARHRN